MSAFRRGLLRSVRGFGKPFSTDSKSARSSPWEAYNDALEKSPLVTKSITTAVLSLVADVICQKAFPNKASSQGGGKGGEGSREVGLDLQRVGKFTLLGLVLVGPSLHRWYGFLNSFSKNSLVKLALDQLLFAPVFVATFLSSALLLDGKSNEIRPKLERDLAPTVVANCSLWVPAQLVNFNFVPAKFQVLFSNCVGVLWNIYLSYKCYGEGPRDEGGK